MIQNSSAHEIVLKNVQVDGQVIFTGEQRLDGCVGLSSAQKIRSTPLKADFSRWPRKIQLLAYDNGLQKEVRGEVKLPFASKHSSTPFHIVYESGDFRYDDIPYP